MGRLDLYINDNRDKPFDWSSHNCLTFVDGFHKGKIDPEWIEGFDNPKDALRLYRKLKGLGEEEDILEAFDNIFEPRETLHPREGWIIFRSGGSVLCGSFGLVYRNSGTFVGERGLEFTPLQPNDLYWKPE